MDKLKKHKSQMAESINSLPWERYWAADKRTQNQLVGGVLPNLRVKC